MGCCGAGGTRASSCPIRLRQEVDASEEFGHGAMKSGGPEAAISGYGRRVVPLMTWGFTAAAHPVMLGAFIMYASTGTVAFQNRRRGMGPVDRCTSERMCDSNSADRLVREAA